MFIAVVAVMILVCRVNCLKPKKRFLSSVSCTGLISVNGVHKGSPRESIHFKKVGHGKILLILLPGNNCSGQVFDGILNQFRSDVKRNRNYTVITFDYRGSGKSSYNQPITDLSDFSYDIDAALSEFSDLKDYEISVVAYSIGFPIGIELIKMNPERYVSLLGFSPVGTRGVRAEFNETNVGVDSCGKEWKAGDWLPTENDHNGIDAAAFHQREWQGSNRTFIAIKGIWDSIVFNDELKFDPAHNLAGHSPLYDNPAYVNALSDCQDIQYMPESLFYAHTYNASGIKLEARKNSDGEVVEIETGNTIDVFFGKRILLVKAKTDIENWRGDLVVDDESFSESYDDFLRVGAHVDSIHIDAGQGYDHGLIITRPAEMSTIIDQFINCGLNATVAEVSLSANSDYRSSVGLTAA